MTTDDLDQILKYGKGAGLQTDEEKCRNILIFCSVGLFFPIHRNNLNHHQKAQFSSTFLKITKQGKEKHKNL